MNMVLNNIDDKSLTSVLTLNEAGRALLQIIRLLVAHPTSDVENWCSIGNIILSHHIYVKRNYYRYNSSY